MTVDILLVSEVPKGFLSKAEQVHIRHQLVDYFINSSTMRKMDVEYFDRFLHSLRSVEITE